MPGLCLPSFSQILFLAWINREFPHIVTGFGKKSDFQFKFDFHSRSKEISTVIVLCMKRETNYAAFEDVRKTLIKRKKTELNIIN